MNVPETRIKRNPEVRAQVRAGHHTQLSEGTELPKALVSSGPKSSQMELNVPIQWRASISN